MSSNTYNGAENWGREIARINSSVDELEAKFDAECQTLRDIVCAQIEEVRTSLRRLESKITATSADAYIQKIAAQIEELKLKGDAAYELIQGTLQGGDSRHETATDAEHPRL